MRVLATTASRNSTALQLHLVPKEFEGKHYGAVVWVDEVSIKDVEV